MTAAVRDIVALMETFAPQMLAEDWDNVGLQIGGRDWPVNKIWIALEATREVILRACAEKVSLLITHHPLLFHPLKTVDADTAVGRIIQVALENRLALFCAHTNLDRARGGVSDVLAEKLGLCDTRVLKASGKGDALLRKLVVFVPAGHEEALLNEVFESGAGKGHKYTRVSFRTKGVGTFRPGPGARPFQGRIGRTSHTDEFRIEVLVSPMDLPAVIKNLEGVHPYEEMAYDVYSTGLKDDSVGLGRIGNLAEPLLLKHFCRRIKEELAIGWIKVVGDPVLTVSRVAVCGGSGGGLLDAFLSSDAQVYVSGDLGYHDGRTVEAEGRAMVDIGHFASEQPVIGSLAGQLNRILSTRGFAVDVTAIEDQRDCFYYL